MRNIKLRIDIFDMLTNVLCEVLSFALILMGVLAVVAILTVLGHGEVKIVMLGVAMAIYFIMDVVGKDDDGK